MSGYMDSAVRESLAATKIQRKALLRMRQQVKAFANSKALDVLEDVVDGMAITIDKLERAFPWLTK